MSDQIGTEAPGTPFTNTDTVKFNHHELQNGTPMPSSVPMTWRSRILDLLDQYSSLSKLRLTSLVVASTALGYYMAGPFSLTHRGVATFGGTFLAICSANSINQMMEIESDRKMIRTGNRLLPSGRMSKRHAVAFATVTAVTGIAWLWQKTTPVTTALAASNIFLYTAVYTPLKKRTVWNTWVGAVVGSIPPLIGYSAVRDVDWPSVAVMGGLLYLWQIPHFLALSYYISDDYEAGGYEMYAQRRRESTPMMSLVHTYAMLPIGLGAYATGFTHWLFVPVYTALNGYFCYQGHLWLADHSNKAARKVFFGSLTFLSATIVAMLLFKRNRPLDEEDSLAAYMDRLVPSAWLPRVGAKVSDVVGKRQMN